MVHESLLFIFHDPVPQKQIKFSVFGIRVPALTPNCGLLSANTQNQMYPLRHSVKMLFK